MDPYVGEIRMFGGNFAPYGWELCNGQLLSIAQYETLFSLIGTTYGGDGVSTFALPDFQGRVVVHMGQNPATGTTFSLGQKGGSEYVTLTADQLPAHTHSANCTPKTSDYDVPANAVWGFSTGVNQYSTKNPDVSMNEKEAIESIGGNQPHTNIMPSLTINYIIATNGIYPSRQ